MYFGELPINEALGCYLAHSRDTANGRLRKGLLLTEKHLLQLVAEGIESLIVARLEKDDIHENEAAELVAAALTTLVTALPSDRDATGQVNGKSAAQVDGIICKPANTGRVNLHANHTGLCQLDRQCILDINKITPSITVSTLPENQWVHAGRMVATVKIIPYAVEKKDLLQVQEICKRTKLARITPLNVVAPIQQQAHVVQTTLPQTSQKLLEKTVRVTSQRLIHRDCKLVSESLVEHDSNKLANRLVELNAENKASDGTSTDSWILIVGASAISDVDDVIPAAIIAAGGEIHRYGMPVDPGNLLLLARLDNHPIVGLPGCARSPKYNGFDQILDRMACRLPISDDWISGLAIGGLMGEILERPSPRMLSKAKTDIATDITANITVSANLTDSTHSIENKKSEATQQPTHWKTQSSTAASIAQQNERELPLEHLLSAPESSAVANSNADSNSTGEVAQHDREIESSDSKCSGVAGVLLAAGSSKRFGNDNKLLANLPTTPDQSLSASALQNMQHYPIEQICVITGHQGERVKQHLQESLASSKTTNTPGQHDQVPVRFLQNPLYQSGMSTSLAMAISHLLDSSATLICLADMPAVTPDIIAELLNAWNQHPEKAAFVPVMSGKRGNPVLLTRILYDQILTLEGDTGARKLLRDNSELVMEVHLSNPGIVTDYDTRDELNSNPAADKKTTKGDDIK